jgi:hypothetical protein
MTEQSTPEPDAAALMLILMETGRAEDAELQVKWGSWPTEEHSLHLATRKPSGLQPSKGRCKAAGALGMLSTSECIVGTGRFSRSPPAAGGSDSEQCDCAQGDRDVNVRLMLRQLDLRHFVLQALNY